MSRRCSPAVSKPPISKSNYVTFGFDTPQRTRARLLNQRRSLNGIIDGWVGTVIFRPVSKPQIIGKPRMNKKTLFTLLFILLLLILLAYLAVDSNAGGIFRTATPTSTNTATPIASPLGTNTSTPTFTPTTLAPGASAGVTCYLIHDTLVLLLQREQFIPIWKEKLPCA